MKTNRENIRETDMWHLSLNKRIDSQHFYVTIFEKKKLFLREAAKIFLLNYGCVLFGAYS